MVPEAQEVANRELCCWNDVMFYSLLNKNVALKHFWSCLFLLFCLLGLLWNIRAYIPCHSCGYCRHNKTHVFTQQHMRLFSVTLAFYWPSSLFSVFLWHTDFVLSDHRASNVRFAQSIRFYAHCVQRGKTQTWFLSESCNHWTEI